MSTAATQPGQQIGGMSALNVAMKSQLCDVEATGPALVSHVGALLAFTPAVTRHGGAMVFSFSHGATAAWAVAAMADPHCKLMGSMAGRARLVVFDARNRLVRFGFRHDVWRFGSGADASLAACVGAVHAGGVLSKHGLKVGCPNAGLMLTLTAIMARLDIAAAPAADGLPLRVCVGARMVPGVLERLGLADVGAAYARARAPRNAGVGRG